MTYVKDSSIPPHPYDFMVEYLPDKKMGFVDYLSRHPWGCPVPVSYDDEKFVLCNCDA